MENECVRVEYRGVSDSLAPGDVLVVESCEAGVLVAKKITRVEVSYSPSEGMQFKGGILDYWKKQDQEQSKPKATSTKGKGAKHA
jgi:hypothetical protein